MPTVGTIDVNVDKLQQLDELAIRVAVGEIPVSVAYWQLPGDVTCCFWILGLADSELRAVFLRCCSTFLLWWSRLLSSPDAGTRTRVLSPTGLALHEF